MQARRVAAPRSRAPLLLSLSLSLWMGQSATTSTGYNLWWCSNFTEIKTPLELQVQGTLPAWLQGTLLRNGPGAYEWGEQRVQHQFDGLAKVAKFHFEGQGKVQFQTAFLETDLFKDTVAQNDMPPHMTMLPVEPAYSKVQVAEAMMMNDMDNTNIFPWQTGNLTMLLSDTTTLMTSINLDSLETLGHAVVTSLALTFAPLEGAQA